MSASVQLTAEEMWQAAIVGARRRIESIEQNLHGLFTDEKVWTNEIEGAAAEMALAKHRGTYWSGIAQRAERDVGDMQVRQTCSDDGCLIIRERDLAGDPYFVLVTGMLGQYRIVGWMRASEGRRVGALRNPGGRGAAWFVPQSALHEVPGRA